MKTMIKSAMIIILISTVTVGAAAQDKQDSMAPMGPRFGFGEPGCRGPEMILTKLDLTDEQQAKLKDIRYENSKKLIGLESKVKLEALELRNLIANDADKKNIDKQIDKLSDARAKVQKQRLGMHFRMKDVLTEEQWGKFQEMRPRAGNWREGHDRMSRFGTRRHMMRRR